MKFLAFFIAVVWANTSNAQIVRSGEHDNFTRLVISLPSGNPWRIGQTSDGYLIQIDQQVEFDLSRAFDLIPRNRVRDLLKTDEGLLILSNCECHLDAFQINEIQFVVDVIDGPPPEELAYELVNLEVQSEPIAESADTAVEMPLALPLSNQRSSSRPLFPIVFEEAMTSADLPSVPLLLLVDPISQDTPGTDVSGARDEFFVSISRGAAQGVVDPIRPEIQLPVETIDESVEEVSLEAAQIDLPIEGLPIRATTAFDREQQLAITNAPQTNVGGPCISDERVDVQSWGSDGDPFAKIAELEARLFDARDNVDPIIAAELARTYLTIGFGSEVRALLHLVPETEDAGLLDMMAAVIEDLPKDPMALRSQIECDSAIALWALLATTEASPDIALQVEPVLRAFAFLPSRIKAAVSGQLIDQLRRAGELDAAHQIIRLVDADVPESLVEHEVAEAELLLLDGESEAATIELQAAALDPQANNPEALAALIEVRISEGQRVSAESLELAEAMAAELRGSEIAERLKSAEIRGRMANGEIDHAHRMLVELSPSHEGLWSELAILMVEQASLEDFLRFSAIPPSAELTGEARNLMARRLIDAGVPSLATIYVSSTISGRNSEETQLLRAEISALAGDVAEVRRLTRGIDSDRIGPLLTLAAERSQDPAVVLEVAASLATTPTPDQNWRAGAWDGLTDIDEQPDVRNAARIMSARSVSVGEGDDALSIGPEGLEGRRELLAESAAARETVAALLERFPAPDGTE